MEACWDALARHSIEVVDDVGQKYVAGMVAQVLAFQTSDDISHDTIAETIRPSVYYNEKLIQRAEIIVATPPPMEDAVSSAATAPSDDHRATEPVASESAQLTDAAISSMPAPHDDNPSPTPST